MIVRKMTLIFLARDRLGLDCSEKAVFNENFHPEKGSNISGYDMNSNLSNFIVCHEVDDRSFDDEKWEEFENLISTTTQGKFDKMITRSIFGNVFKALKELFGD